MKRGIETIILLLAVVLFSPVILAGEMEDCYQTLANQFEIRAKDTDKALQSYLQRYPYTTYADEVNMMLGVLQVESRRYKKALKSFEVVEIKRLSRPHQPMYEFYHGYAYLMVGKYKESTTYFRHLKEKTSLYTLQARYYYAYAMYKEGQYRQALPDFLAIEHTAQYKNIVPYYIIQIYYAQGNLGEVESRAENMIANNPDNENIGEIHRILGELYYTNGDYDKSIRHLTAYRQSFQNQGRKLVRNDIYLLGMAYYHIADYSKAIPELRQIEVKNDSITENTYLHLGHCYTHTSNLEQGKLAYAAAMRMGITPRLQEEATYNYALCTYQSSTALGESINAFSDFLNSYPKSRHVNKVTELLADVFMRSNNYAAAYEAICNIKKPTAKMEATKQYLRYQLGTDAFIQGQMNTAIKYFTEVIQNRTPHSQYVTEAYYFLAECDYRKHAYTKTQLHLQNFYNEPDVKKSPNYIASKYLNAYSLFNQKFYAQAEKSFREYIKEVDTSSPTYADALNRLGDCRFHDRKFSDAINYYSQVMQLDASGSDYAAFQCGYALGLLHKYDEKISMMRTLTEHYPRSDYADDALYEMARAYLETNKSEAAIDTYTQLLKQYPHSNLCRKSALEQGMIYRNIGENEKAITAFKQIINRYPGSEEAYTALEGLEQIYVSSNNINDYLTYTRKLGKNTMKVATQEDSLTYITAELQYVMGNYAEAAAGMATYITKYCNGGRYCTNAQYYSADCYYRLGQKTEALKAYRALTDIQGNSYMEEACVRVAEITFDQADYNTSFRYFNRLLEVASSKDNRNIARLGALRCSYKMNDREQTIRSSYSIISSEEATDVMRNEARYYRAKTYMADKQYLSAESDLQQLTTEVRTAIGAESKYMLANCYYLMGRPDDAENEIISFAGSNTQHQYWLAKALILLADIYTQRGDSFQAQQYLLSLKSNYRTNDDIPSLIDQRLTAISKAQETELTKEVADEPIAEEEQE